MDSTIAAYSPNEIISLQSNVGLQLKDQLYKVFVTNPNAQVYFARSSRGVLETWASSKNIITNHMIESLIRYGKTTSPITKEYLKLTKKEKVAGQQITSTSNPLGGPEAGIVYRYVHDPLRPQPDSPFAEDFITVVSASQVLKFHDAARWLASLNYKVLTRRNPYHITQQWARIEYALNLPSVNAPGAFGVAFKPRPPPEVGRFVGGSWVWDNPANAEIYSTPTVLDEQRPTWIHIEFRDEKGVVGVGDGITTDKTLLVDGEHTGERAPLTRDMMRLVSALRPISLKRNYTSCKITPRKQVIATNPYEIPKPGPDRTGPFLYTVVGSKASGKSTLIDGIIRSKNVIDSDDWGMWLASKISAKLDPKAPRNSPQLKISPLGEFEVPPTGSFFENVVSYLFATLKQKNPQKKEIAFVEMYQGLMLDWQYGIWAFVGDKLQQFDNDLDTVVLTHTSLESNAILGVYRNYKLVPLFDPVSTIKMRARDTELEVDLFLQRVYNYAVGAEVELSIPQLIDIFTGGKTVVIGNP
jgi:hypothetical protein